MLLQEEGNATVIADTQFATSFLSLCQKCTSRGPGGGLSFSFGTCGKNTSCRASGSAWICKVKLATGGGTQFFSDSSVSEQTRIYSTAVHYNSSTAVQQYVLHSSTQQYYTHQLLATSYIQHSYLVLLVRVLLFVLVRRITARHSSSNISTLKNELLLY